MVVTVCAYVKFPERWAALEQGAGPEAQPVAIVVNVREGDAIFAVAENVEHAGLPRLQDVRQKQLVPRPVHLNCCIVIGLEVIIRSKKKE